MVDGLIFEKLFLYPFVDGIVRAFVFVCISIFDVVVMSVIVKGGVFEVIGHGRTKQCMVL